MNNKIAPDKTQDLTSENFEVLKIGGSKAGKYARLILAVMSSIPWIGGVLSAAATLSAEASQSQINKLLEIWINEHKDKLNSLKQTIEEIISKLDSLDDEIQQRIQSEEYLNIVRKAFFAWDQADTKEKREMIKNLIMNAGATKLCPDDLVRLFIDWINRYHEAHFRVISEIYKKPNITRGEIWDTIHGQRPREDSAEAGLYRYLISELTLGRILQQTRTVNFAGQFLKSKHKSSGTKDVMESAFEDTKPYELTSLGMQFVHYVMNDLVPRITV